MMTDSVKKIFGNASWEFGDVILKHIPITFPKIKYEYADPLLSRLSSCCDYGEWKRIAEKEIKEKNLSKEEGFEFILDYFRTKFSREKHQISKLGNSQGELAKEIHIILSDTGYQYQPYFGEGKRLTIDEKIAKLRSKLLKRILNDIDSHFTEDHLNKLLKGRNGIKTTRPEEGLDYYIWRHTRFNLGIDVSLPMIAEWELDKYFNAKTLESEHGLARELVDLLVLKMNVKWFGADVSRGVRRWSRALGW